jgi:hypothetical protein
VNDKLDDPTLSVLAAGGTRLIALRSAGYNNVDLSSLPTAGSRRRTTASRSRSDAESYSWPVTTRSGNSPNGLWVPNKISVPVPQRRGVVFMACHNAIWELAERLMRAEQNPDHLEVDGITAELTNHLIPDVVLSPGVVATLVQLQQSGFAYSR